MRISVCFPYVTKISQIMSCSIRGLKALINPDQENRQRGKGVIIKFKQNYLAGGLALCHVKNHLGCLRLRRVMLDLLINFYIVFPSNVTFCGYFMG